MTAIPNRKIIVCTECRRERSHAGHGLCRSCYSRYFRSLNPDYFLHYNKIYYLRHRETLKAKERQKKADMTWAQRALASGNNKSGIRDGLAIEFLTKLQLCTTNCPCCSIPLDYTVRSISRGSKRRHNLATLDRIDPLRGYIEENVAIICFRCNRLKDNMTQDELRMLIKYVEGFTNGCTHSSAA